MTGGSSYQQEQISRIGGLSHALELVLRAHSLACGKQARSAIEALRDEAIDSFRNSDIPANREMEHAQIAGPAIEAIETVFNSVLSKIGD